MGFDLSFQEKNNATREHMLNHLRQNIYCRLKPSPVHGIGVFAIRDIPKTTLITDHIVTFPLEHLFYRVTEEYLLSGSDGWSGIIYEDGGNVQ